MLKTEANPAGTPIEVFDQLRASVLADRSQFFKDLSMPFYGYNRPGAKISEGKEALAALHKILLQALDGIETAADADEASIRYYCLFRPMHLAAAGERKALDAVLEDPAWLKAKLDAIHMPRSLIADYDRYGHGQIKIWSAMRYA